VRMSTATSLLKVCSTQTFSQHRLRHLPLVPSSQNVPPVQPGTKGAYGRTHHGHTAFIDAGKYRVVDLNPDWYLSNWYSSASEAKATGKISWPVVGSGPKVTVIDPVGFGAAAAAILLQPCAGLAPFLARLVVEVHGVSHANFQDIAAALSGTVGYEIKIQPVPAAAWVAALQGYGVLRVFAQSFLETVQQFDGAVPPGYEAYGAPTWTSETSPELLAIGWKARTREAWAASPATKAAFAK